jgi:hypothetical protein
MTQLTCPTCHQPFDTQQTTAMPFCSERCRLIDLHRWLTEQHSVAVEREEGDGPEVRDEAHRNDG